MRDHMRFSLLCLVILALTLLFACDVALPQSYGLPGKLSSLTDLTPVLERKDLTAAQRTEVLIEWLAQEQANPSPTTKGLGGGDIDTGYIQAQILKALREVGDRWLVEQAASKADSPPRLQQALQIALGLMGDRRQTGRLLRLLEEHPVPYLRALAAEALGNVRASEAASALRRALDDPFSVTVPGCMGVQTIYPVREAAKQALRIIESGGGGKPQSRAAGTGAWAPARDILAERGYGVSWDTAKRELLGKRGTEVIRLQVGSKVARVDGREIQMDEAPRIVDGRVQIPASFAEALR